MEATALDLVFPAIDPKSSQQQALHSATTRSVNLCQYAVKAIATF